MEYPVKVQRCKNGALIAYIQDSSGATIKEIYQEPILNDKVTMSMLRKSVEIMVWSGTLEEYKETLITTDISGDG